MSKLFLSFLFLLVFIGKLTAQNNTTPITMGTLVGVNANAKADWRRLSKFSNIREFHQWSQDIGFSQDSFADCPDINDPYRWVPSYDASGLINFDDFYGRNKGTTVALMGVAPQMTGAKYYPGHERNAELKPLCRTEQLKITDFPSSARGKLIYNTYPGFPIYNSAQPWKLIDCAAPEDNNPDADGYIGFGVGDYVDSILVGCHNGYFDQFIYYDNYYAPSSYDQTKPTTYKEYTRWATLLSLRYGKLHINDWKYQAVTSPYFVNGSASGYTQSYASGLNYLRYYEIQNEPDKCWRDPLHQLWQENPPKDLDAGNTFFQYKPYQFAALMSAAYDGHGKSSTFRLSTTAPIVRLGIKNVNATHKIVMGGLFDFHGAYIEKMMLWCQDNRKPGQLGFINASFLGNEELLPFDVINFHHYSTAQQASPGFSDAQFKSEVYNHYGRALVSGGGVHPEKDKIRDRLALTLLDLRDPHGTDDFGNEVPNLFNTASLNQIKSKEVWVTEFGYDTGSDAGAFNNFVEIPTQYDNGNPLSRAQRMQTQGQWIVRSYLELAAVSVGDEGSTTNPRQQVRKAMVFDILDTEPPQAGNMGYTHSGLLYQDNTPKPSWYQVLTLKNVLNDYEFDEDISLNGHVLTSTGVVSNGNRVYRFKHKNNPDSDVGLEHKFVYAIWRPTFTNSVGTQRKFVIKDQFASNAMNATLIENVDLDEDGTKTTLSLETTFSGADPITTLTLANNPNNPNGIQVSEQPIFIYTSYKPTNAMGGDTIVNSISNLRSEKICCGGVRLIWNKPLSSTTVATSAYSYQVYFARAADSTTINSTAELLVKGILYSDEVTGTYCSVVHPLLKADSSYLFYVIPVRNHNGSRVIPSWSVIAQTIKFVTPESKPFLPIQSWQVTVNSTSWSAKAVADSVFTLTDECLEIPTNYSLDDAFYEGSSIVIDLAGSRRVDAIYFDDFEGMGLMNIEYQLCNQTCWKSMFRGPILLKGYPDSQGKSDWKYVSNLVKSTQVSKIRLSMLNGECGTRSVQICASEPTTCITAACNPAALMQIDVKNIEENVAQFEWPALTQDKENDDAPHIEAYWLTISDKVDVKTGIPVDGIQIPVYDYDNLSSVIFTCNGLEPGTQYFGSVQPAFVGCEGVYNGNPIIVGQATSFNFVTAGTPEEPLLEVSQLKPIKVYPNPATTFLTVDLPSGNFQTIQILTSTGLELYSSTVNSSDLQTNIDVQSLPMGFYILRAIKTDGSYETTPLTIQRQ
jgi:Secretion system C-terminal sorting domain